MTAQVTQTPVTRRQGQQLIFDSDDSTASSAGDLHASQNIDIGQDVSTLQIAAATQNSSPLTDASTSTGLTNHPGSSPADSLEKPKHISRPRKQFCSW